MMIRRVNMDIYQGVPLSWEIPLEPEEVTGSFTAVMGTQSGTTVETFTNTVGTDDDGMPVLKVGLTANETLAVPTGIYRWDCIITKSGVSEAFAIGDVSVMDILSA